MQRLKFIFWMKSLWPVGLSTKKATGIPFNLSWSAAASYWWTADARRRALSFWFQQPSETETGSRNVNRSFRQEVQSVWRDLGCGSAAKDRRASLRHVRRLSTSVPGFLLLHYSLTLDNISCINHLLCLCELAGSAHMPIWPQAGSGEPSYMLVAKGGATLIVIGWTPDDTEQGLIGWLEQRLFKKWNKPGGERTDWGGPAARMTTAVGTPSGRTWNKLTLPDPERLTALECETFVETDHFETRRTSLTCDFRNLPHRQHSRNMRRVPSGPGESSWIRLVSWSAAIRAERFRATGFASPF